MKVAEDVGRVDLVLIRIHGSWLGVAVGCTKNMRCSLTYLSCKDHSAADSQSELGVLVPSGPTIRDLACANLPFFDQQLGS